MSLLILILIVISTASNSQSIPRSPYSFSNVSCNNISSRYKIDDQFPSTPYNISLFQQLYQTPKVRIPEFTSCRADGHCMQSFTNNVIDVQLRPFDKTIPACKNLPATWFLSYNGQVPAGTFRVAMGTETLVRVKNQISNKYFHPHDSCGGNGRPISIHNHGYQTLAPWDGWAEDVTCFNQTKDYLYPNNYPRTGWYHDHALHITSDNAYFGMAGMYIVTGKKKQGGCGEPFNLEDIQERIMMLNDAVLDINCQLLFDRFGSAHHNNFYGDINMVNGVPFPQIPLKAQWYRFRFLNKAVSRPYLITIKNQQNVVISHQICQVFASDGGYRDTAAPFSKSGLRIAIAERWEVACDFSKLGGQTLYFWNDQDDMLLDVPYFCHSHLVAQIKVALPNLQIPSNAVFNPLLGNKAQTVKSVALDDQIFADAMAMVKANKYHRRMDIEYKRDHWVINNKGWDDFKIAAEDVGQNTWQVWLFRSGGGWFHPVHIHLIDFFLLAREGDGVRGIQPYEKDSPKDVFFLGANNKVWLLARFGAHKGDYMFHCHNLVHEDNDMLRAFRVTSGSSGPNAASQSKFILNPVSNIIYSNYKFADPRLKETSAKPNALMRPHQKALLDFYLSQNFYRIFYPLPQDITAMKGAKNPWGHNKCK